MAAEIGISASYLNHLERNQRPVTAGILLRLAEAFDIDMKAFASDGGDTAGADQLGEIFSDAMLADLGVGRAVPGSRLTVPAVSCGCTRLFANCSGGRREGKKEQVGKTPARLSPPRPGCATTFNHSATITRSLKNAARRSAKHSTIRCRYPRRCGDG